MSETMLTWDETRVRAFVLAGDGSLPILDQVARLLEMGASPVNCIKAIRGVHGLGLAACKELVDSALSSEARRANEQLREALAKEASMWAQ